MKQELIFDYFKQQIIANIPFYFLVVGMLFFVMVIKKKSRVNKLNFVALILGCLFLSFFVAGEISIRNYLTYLSDQTDLSAYQTVASYIASIGVDVSYEIRFRYFYSVLGYVFRILILMLSYYFVERAATKRKNVLISIPGILCMLLFISSPWTHWCFYFDEINFFFHNSDLYFTIYFTIGFYILHIFIEIIINYKNNKTTLFYLSFLFIFAFSINFLESGGVLRTTTDVVDGVFLISICLYYLLIESNVTDEDIIIKDKDLYDSRVSIMTSQVRPHFIFNCITNIIELCDDDSKAKEALLTFSRYLRVNINSFNKNDAVLFIKELDYIKNYVSLEEMRYAEKFAISYDIQTSSFYVPLISVEIFVENAIKHNVGQKDEVVHIELKTYEDNENYIVEVVDDGVGFDTAMLNNSNYVGTNNAKYRLENIVHARVSINSVINKGTRVYIEIPKDYEG